MGKAILVLSMLGVILSACSSGSGGGGGGGSSANAEDSQPDIQMKMVPNTLKYESQVLADRAGAVNEALSSIYSLPLDSQKVDVKAMLDLMKISDANPSTLQKWVEDRVQFVVDDGFDIDRHLLRGTETVNYPYADQVPDVLTHQDQVPTVNADEAQVIMSNIGSAVYYAAKQAKQLFSLELGGIGTVPFKSPRAGLLEIGPGLFPDLQGHKVQNILLDVYRASTLFHEARHSDGHGKTLGFFHATCPSWHDYAGKPACDASTNGPYTIGAMVMKNLAAQCTSQCTELTKRALQSLYLDVAGRALSVRDLPHNSPESPAGGAWDDIPEGTP